MSEYETMGELFADMEEHVMALTLWHRVPKCIERLLAALCDVFGFSVSEIGQLIVTDSEMRNNFEIMVKALEDRHQEKLTTAVNIFKQVLTTHIHGYSQSNLAEIPMK